MRQCWAIARLNLLSLLRQRFYWVWAITLVLLVSSLQHITFFDFEGNLLSHQLFFTTLTLGGAVGAFVFFVRFNGEARGHQLDLLTSRPIAPISLWLGHWTAAFSLQLLLTILLTGAYVLDATYLHRPLPPGFVLGLCQVVLGMGMLTTYFGLVALLLPELWAAILMVGGFLVGHLAEPLAASLPSQHRWIVDVMFSLFPDLEHPEISNMSFLLDAHFISELASRAAYPLTYVFLGTCMAVLILRRRFYILPSTGR